MDLGGGHRDTAVSSIFLQEDKGDKGSKKLRLSLKPNAWAGWEPHVRWLSKLPVSDKKPCSFEMDQLKLNLRRSARSGLLQSTNSFNGGVRSKWLSETSRTKDKISLYSNNIAAEDTMARRRRALKKPITRRASQKQNDEVTLQPKSELTESSRRQLESNLEPDITIPGHVADQPERSARINRPKRTKPETPSSFHPMTLRSSRQPHAQMLFAQATHAVGQPEIASAAVKPVASPVAGPNSLVETPTVAFIQGEQDGESGISDSPADCDGARSQADLPVTPSPRKRAGSDLESNSSQRRKVFTAIRNPPQPNSASSPLVEYHLRKSSFREPQGEVESSEIPGPFSVLASGRELLKAGADMRVLKEDELGLPQIDLSIGKKDDLVHDPNLEDKEESDDYHEQQEVPELHVGDQRVQKDQVSESNVESRSATRSEPECRQSESIGVNLSSQTEEECFAMIVPHLRERVLELRTQMKIWVSDYFENPDLTSDESGEHGSTDSQCKTPDADIEESKEKINGFVSELYEDMPDSVVDAADEIAARGSWWTRIFHEPELHKWMVYSILSAFFQQFIFDRLLFGGSEAEFKALETVEEVLKTRPMSDFLLRESRATIVRVLMASRQRPENFQIEAEGLTRRFWLQVERMMVQGKDKDTCITSLYRLIVDAAKISIDARSGNALVHFRSCDTDTPCKNGEVDIIADRAVTARNYTADSGSNKFVLMTASPGLSVYGPDMHFVTNGFPRDEYYTEQILCRPEVLTYHDKREQDQLPPSGRQTLRFYVNEARRRAEAWKSVLPLSIPDKCIVL